MERRSIFSRRSWNPIYPRLSSIGRKKAFPFPFGNGSSRVWLRWHRILCSISRAPYRSLSTVVLPRICYTRIRTVRWTQPTNSGRLLFWNSGVGLLKYQYNDWSKHYLFRKRLGCRSDEQAPSDASASPGKPGVVGRVDRIATAWSFSGRFLAPTHKGQEICTRAGTCRAKFIRCDTTGDPFLRCEGGSDF